LVSYKNSYSCKRESEGRVGRFVDNSQILAFSTRPQPSRRGAVS